MPLYRGRRRRYKRKPYNRKGPSSYMGTAQKGLYLAGRALSIAQGVRSIINSEKKTYTSQVLNGTQSTTATIVELSGISQGDDYFNRDGRSILAKSLEVSGWLYMNNSATTTAIRIIIFKDNNADGSDPTALDVLQTSNTYSLRNPDPHQMKRFHIMLDKLYLLDTAKSRMAKFDYFKNLNHHIKYAGTTGNVSNEGSLWALLISNEPVNQPTLNLTSRIRFYDN